MPAFQFNVEVEMANVQKTISKTKILLVSKDHAVEKQSDLMYLEVGLEAAIQPKKQRFKKRKIC